MLRVKVSLPSGCGETLSCPELSTVDDLQRLAETSLGKPSLKLVTAKGHVLSLDDPRHRRGTKTGSDIICFRGLQRRPGRDLG